MRQQLSESYLSHYYWHEDGEIGVAPYLETAYDGKITTQCASGDYDGDNRTDALVEALADAKKVLIKLPSGIVSVELRFRSDGSANDDSIIQLFAAAGVDHYRNICQLTVTQGTQKHSGSIYFCDGVTPANEVWHTTVTELSGTGNHMGGYTFNTHGYDRLWIVANDLDTTTLYVDWKQL